MTRIEPYLNPLQNSKELYLLLKKYQTITEENKEPLIISLAWKIPPVDPLAVLKIFAQPKKSHFYLEKREDQEFILALDTVIKQEIQGQNRFSDSKIFIDSYLNKIILGGDIYLPFASPRFCCSFSFFANDCHIQDTFPDATVFLPAIQVARRQQDFALTINVMIDAEINLYKLVDKIEKQVKKILTLGEFKSIHKTVSNKDYLFSLDPHKTEHFQASVELALQSIRTQNLSKLVVAHSINVDLPSDFKAIQTLSYLRQSYPNCHTFSLSNGQGLNFIGASPERLLKIHNHQLITDALAGSAPRGKTAIEDYYFGEYLLNNHKEREEHQIVKKFILQHLINLKITPLSSTSPQLLRLANIQHLWTPIRAELINKIHPLDLVASLHPTPAVAGIPQKLACQKIRSNETFERNLYAAPFGWIDCHGNSEFVVGIRSALLKEDSARLYAGAGIVAESDSKMETDEITLKFQPVLSSLFVSEQCKSNG